MKAFPWGALLEWYRGHGRHELPWRNYDLSDENLLLYRIWISEIFLQQTQVSRVIGYFERVLSAFPTIESLAKTDYETFFPYYQGLGYYSRARNILKAADIINTSFNGIFPKEKEKLRKLPGVGPYTANALLAFGYGEPYLAWDTNLEKVFSRYYKGRKDIKLTKEEKEEIEKDFYHFLINLTRTVNGESEGAILSERSGEQQKVERKQSTSEFIDPSGPFGTFQSGKVQEKDIIRAINNALMDFAATVDLKNPDTIDWENYPIREGVFYETKGSLEPKEEKKSMSFPLPDATIIVVLHKEHKIYYNSPISVIPGLSRNPDKKEKIPSEHRFLHAQEGQEQYTPFTLPPALHRDTRKYVQEYFREHYGLELSVRPIHKKWLDDEGKPHIEVNAQIQVGVPAFEIFEKKRGIFAKKSQEA